VSRRFVPPKSFWRGAPMHYALMKINGRGPQLTPTYRKTTTITFLHLWPSHS